jgi:hypothetical protein
MLRGVSIKRYMQIEGGPVKREILLATAALLAMLVLVPMALAQDTTVMDGTTFLSGTVAGGPTIVTDVFGPPPTVEGSPTPGPIPPSGGPAILLPAAALLVGSGILTYAILRRR